MYHYTFGGLQDVYLANGYTTKQTQHGEAVAFVNGAGLEQAIRDALLTLAEGQTIVLRENQGCWELSPTSTIGHLNAALQTSDTAAFLLALGGAVHAHGEAAIAQTCSWSLTELEAILMPESAPRFSDVQRICCALGLRLTVQPLHA